MKMNFFKLLIKLGMFGNYITDADVGGSEVEETQDPDAQRILDAIASGETAFEEAPSDEDTKLPSDEEDEETNQDEEENPEDGELLAGKYKNTDELKKGIINLKSTLPEYVLNGMTDEALVQHYNELELEFSKGRKHIKKVKRSLKIKINQKRRNLMKLK